MQWRTMRSDDLDAVVSLADASHPDLPESWEVFAERLVLYPAGCLVLEDDGDLGGYAVSHPIRRSEPPALGALIGSLPADPDQFYIHDVVIAPSLRRGGAAASGVARLLSLASEFETAALISVYGTAAFWSRFGFTPSQEDMAIRLRPYGADAVYMVRSNRA